MIHTMVFFLPEDDGDLKIKLMADNMYFAINEILEELRQAYKYNDKFRKMGAFEIRQFIVDKLLENNVNLDL